MFAFENIFLALLLVYLSICILGENYRKCPTLYRKGGEDSLVRKNKNGGPWLWCGGVVLYYNQPCAPKRRSKISNFLSF